MDLTVRTGPVHTGRSYRWLASEKGTQTMRTVTLDLAQFNFAATFTSKVIPAGVVLGKVTADGKYGAYDNGAADGTEVAAGFLFETVDVSSYEGTSLTGEVVVPLLIEGFIDESELPANHGLDAAAKTDLGSWFRFF